MTISELQEQVKALKAAQGWPEGSVDRRIVFLVSEVGEMAKEVLNLTYATSDGETQKMKEALGMEIYDIIWNLCDLANLIEIDLETVFAKKQVINSKRQW